ncbi:MAG: glycosyltransferase [Sterolibacteriaceae bacterium]|nr:glycosyltransferase [Sterolibacteriaceae bacterium]MBK9087133.1 glycosyltransferase [Sterolibacteriaceae bacterium]
MHIVHTEASCGWGGQELRILSESQGMIARGHNITLICPREARIHDEALARGIEVHALPISRKTLAGVFALRRWLNEHPRDVINTHSSTDSWLAALACSSLRGAPPIVRTRHISAPTPRNAATRWLYTRATRHIVTTGETLRRTLIADNGYPADKITSIPTGIDTLGFTPGDRDSARAALGLPGDATVVGIVATLRSWKGHRYLIDAVASLAGERTLLLIVGDGPQRDALAAQTAALGLESRIRFAGDQQDVRPWLHSMDVFALPSYANEGVPQALLQAMLCGLPCVTTDVGSIGEIAQNGTTALVVPAQDASQLAAALARLLGDAALRQRLGEAARAHCAGHFGLETMLDKMEAVFRNVVSAARAH